MARLFTPTDLENKVAQLIRAAGSSDAESILGSMRSVAVCSTGWWVGPSSPRPIES